jgi:DNA-binding response OmpR family regulator
MSGDRTVLPTDRINLERICVLIVDKNLQSLDIIGSALTGFGVRSPIKCQSVKDAKDAIRKSSLDLVITDAVMPEETGYDLIRWLRSDAGELNKYVPAMICAGHTQLSRVLMARDCGAHFIVAKPITPNILLQRIFWLAREERSFVECDSYVGPDRRFKRLGPPAGTEGRRSDDLRGKLRDAGEPNLSQEEIDSFMKPARVAI